LAVLRPIRIKVVRGTRPGGLAGISRPL